MVGPTSIIRLQKWNKHHFNSRIKHHQDNQHVYKQYKLPAETHILKQKKRLQFCRTHSTHNATCGWWRSPTSPLGLSIPPALLRVLKQRALKDMPRYSNSHSLPGLILCNGCDLKCSQEQYLWLKTTWLKLLILYKYKRTGWRKK